MTTASRSGGESNNQDGYSGMRLGGMQFSNGGNPWPRPLLRSVADFDPFVITTQVGTCGRKLWFPVLSLMQLLYTKAELDLFKADYKGSREQRVQRGEREHKYRLFLFCWIKQIASRRLYLYSLFKDKRKVLGYGRKNLLSSSIQHHHTRHWLRIF